MALFGLFKKEKKPPAAPNYRQVQQEQTAADTETTKQQSQLNNPTQVNPFGTQTTTYDETGTPTVTQKLTDDAQSALTAQQQTQKMLAESGAAAAKRYQDMISKPFNPNLAGIQTSFNQGGNIMSDPNQRFGQQSDSQGFSRRKPIEEEREPEMTFDDAQTRANSDAWRERVKQRRMAGQQSKPTQQSFNKDGAVTGQIDDETFNSLPENLKSYAKQMGGIPEGDSDYFQRAIAQKANPEAYKQQFGELAEFSPSSQSSQQRPRMGGQNRGQQSGGGVFDKSASGDFTGGNITTDPNTDRFGEASGGYQGGNIMLDSGMSRYGDASGNFTGQQARTDLDLSNVAKMPVNAGMTGQQAIMSRLDPQIQRMDERARQRLANQGLTYGGEAYNRAMGDVNQSNNDLLSQAALQGIGLDMSANQQGYNQALSNAGFYNQGVGQNYQQGMGSQQARNQALLQNQNSALANQQSLNAAQQQQYGQGMDTQAARNAAIAQNKQEAIARSQFMNQAQQQGFTQGMSRQDAMNAAIGQNQNSALARQQAMNSGQQQQFNQDLARAQFGNTSQDQLLNQQLQLRQQPLNEVMGLMGGSQIQLPQFQGYQAANKSPQEIMLAQQAQDKALMDRYGIQSANINARNSATAGLIGGIAGLAAAPMTGGTSLAGTAFSKMF